ncbi:MAG: ATP synthase subunit I [Candidatus Cloacimonetes bacterium]|nr:ATP synthase subunit I [Candidatus Cloacimonadota bacterium]
MKNPNEIDSVDNHRYIRRILVIIYLTTTLSILFLPMFFGEAIGWMLGSIASSINFILLARSIRKGLNLEADKSKLKAVKGTLLRYVFLIVYSILIMIIIKPNILTFGISLLSAQIAIYVNEVLENLKRSKYH